MERIQVMILVLISSSWFLTCDRENKILDSRIVIENPVQSIADSTVVTGNDDSDFYSRWMSPSFAGSGTNWVATINAPFFSGEIPGNDVLSVYMKKAGEIFKLNYNSEEGSIDHSIDHGEITISSDFYPEGIEFMYVISRDGTFVKQNVTDMKYMATIK